MAIWFLYSGLSKICVRCRNVLDQVCPHGKSRGAVIPAAPSAVRVLQVRWNLIPPGVLVECRHAILLGSWAPSDAVIAEITYWVGFLCYVALDRFGAGHVGILVCDAELGSKLREAYFVARPVVRHAVGAIALFGYEAVTGTTLAVCHGPGQMARVSGALSVAAGGEVG